MALAYWTLHYGKRIAETFTVHNFGHATMPVFNLFKNCAYYWGFAAFVSYFVNHPLFTAPPLAQSAAALALALACQAGNLRSHVLLARLRAPGEKGYKIPRGFLFDYVTCANYTFETAGWLLFGIATQTAAALAFIAAGAFQMSVWALQKHRRLQRQFDGKDGRPKYPRRWVMLPPFF
jgi:very-long-chain enoyl-CoA reductase